jgi:hypothetical protein
MCVMVYLASDRPAPLIPWDATRPGFHVSELPEHRQDVRKQFSRPHVCRLGSHEGCGCGFQYGEYEGFEDEVDWPQKRESRRRLVEFVSALLCDDPEVELYACWDGDENLPAEQTDRIRPGELIAPRTFFRERELLVVSE